METRGGQIVHSSSLDWARQARQIGIKAERNGFAQEGVRIVFCNANIRKD